MKFTSIFFIFIIQNNIKRKWYFLAKFLSTTYHFQLYCNYKFLIYKNEWWLPNKSIPLLIWWTSENDPLLGGHFQNIFGTNKLISWFVIVKVLDFLTKYLTLLSVMQLLDNVTTSQVICSTIWVILSQGWMEKTRLDGWNVVHIWTFISK